jgi:hypothetical protein
VEIDIKLETHLANKTFFNALHARYCPRNPAHLFLKIRGRRCIEQRPNGRTQLLNSVEQNNRRGAKAQSSAAALPVARPVVILMNASPEVMASLK